MAKNIWVEHAPELADAYIRSAGSVRFEVVTRSLLARMPETRQRVVDIGGGYGQQAIMLARAGHSVMVVDIDSHMLDIARNALADEAEEVASRVELVLGDGEKALNLVGADFDLACCHSVLMYHNDPRPLLASLVRLARPGGMISVLSLNTEAKAMRSGLQGRWKDAAAALGVVGLDVDSPYVECHEHGREEVCGMLEAEGAKLKAWEGVGIFTDHLTETLFVEDPEDVYLVELIAGSRDPYRQVARCFHLIAERSV